ncbi:hypothetical protein [Prosthecobacter sp.]
MSGLEQARYKGMTHELVPSGKQRREVLTRAVKASAIVVENPTVGEP